MFGSALASATPRDVDLLIVYQSGVPLGEVNRLARDSAAEVEAAVGHHIHLMILSHAECRSVPWLADTELEPMEEWLRRRHCRPLANRSDARRRTVVAVARDARHA